MIVLRPVFRRRDGRLLLSQRTPGVACLPEDVDRARRDCIARGAADGAIGAVQLGHVDVFGPDGAPLGALWRGTMARLNAAARRWNRLVRKADRLRRLGVTWRETGAANIIGSRPGPADYEVAARRIHRRLPAVDAQYLRACAVLGGAP